VLVLDEDLINEMDKSYDEEGNEINYDKDGEEEEEKKKDEGDDEDDANNISREKTPDMSIKTFMKHTDFVTCVSFNPANPD